ncbi:MAG: ANTAR domain-containing response regulator [Anaerofustis sp.]
MSDVLIVSSSQKSSDFLTGFMKENFGSGIKTAKSGSDARRILNEKDFPVVIINTPLSDEFGNELAINATEISSAGIVLIVKNEIVDEVAENVEDYGVLTVAKPINRILLHQTVKLAFSTHSRVVGFKKENVQLQSKIEEMRLVDRAKCVLIQYLTMSEPQAHRYIEKQAMDMRVSKRVIAEGILKTYETY